MRFALLSDIHGNLEALEAVLRDIANQGSIDAYFCLGDIVGYGADPESCLERITSLSCIAVAGNHDHAAIGCLDPSYFNDYARHAALWTRAQLSAGATQYLRSLSLVVHTNSFSVVHGSLHSPELFNYIQNVKDAERNFSRMDNSLLFVGHSHQPQSFYRSNPMLYSYGYEISIYPQCKTIVNIGSVGQPRDDDPRASYAIYDEESAKVTICRVNYDIDKAADKILSAGLPDALALRLSLGK